MNAVLAYTAALEAFDSTAINRALRSSPSAGWFVACSDCHAGAMIHVTATN
jgi:hypothetical protein